MGRYFAAMPVIVAGLLVLSACSVINGSGHVETETRQVSGFTGIDLAGSGEVTIEQGDAESLTIEADDNVLPALTSKVSDSTLKLGKKPGTTVRTKREPANAAHARCWCNGKASIQPSLFLSKSGEAWRPLADLTPA